MLRKTMIALMAMASISILTVDAASARGGFGGGGGGFHGGGGGGGGFASTVSTSEPHVLLDSPLPKSPE